MSSSIESYEDIFLSIHKEIVSLLETEYKGAERPSRIPFYSWVSKCSSLTSQLYQLDLEDKDNLARKLFSRLAAISIIAIKGMADHKVEGIVFEDQITVYTWQYEPNVENDMDLVPLVRAFATNSKAHKGIEKDTDLMKYYHCFFTTYNGNWIFSLGNPPDVLQSTITVTLKEMKNKSK